MSISDGGKRSSNENGKRMDKARTEKNDENNVCLWDDSFIFYFLSVGMAYTHTRIS